MKVDKDRFIALARTIGVPCEPPENEEYGWMIVDGVTVDGPEDALIQPAFGPGFCGCGRVMDAFRFIAAELELFSDDGHIPYDESIWERPHSYFVWYCFDAWEWTGHGGSVPGWLTTKGEVMRDLIQLIISAAEDKH